MSLFHPRRSRLSAPAPGIETLHAPQFESLEPRVLMSVTPVAETEPNNKRGQADAFVMSDANDVQLTGESVNKGDVDFFTFVATKSGTLHIAVDNDAPLDVRLFQGKRQLKDRIKNAPATLRQIDVVEGQTYFVRLRSKGNVAAEYALTLTLTADATPAVSPGVDQTIPENQNDIAPSFFLPGDSTARLIGAIASPLDRDSFDFTALTSGTLSLAIANDAGRPVDLLVQDDRGQQVLLLQQTSTATVAVDGGRTYTISLAASEGQPSGYNVDLALIPGQPQPGNNLVVLQNISIFFRSSVLVTINV